VILIDEIERPRSGPMRDIVATIQPDQDDIVRADAAQTVCVQGAPGTGKTAVGLHRVAYLLYAYPGKMLRGGVLVIGPNRAFLSYIRNVLPALGEAAREAFGPLYLDVLRRFDALFGRPAPYIAAWHQAPVADTEARRAFAAHLQVLSIRRAPGKLKYLAGTESGTGVWINDIVPEEAAHRLRQGGPGGRAVLP